MITLAADSSAAVATRADRRAAPPISDAALRLLARFRPVTFTCVPPSSGERIGGERVGMARGSATSATPTPIPPIRSTP